MDIYAVIFLVLFVLIAVWLRSVLGQRTGRERPQYDPYPVRRAGGDSKVVAMPRRPGDAPAPPVEAVRPVEPVETSSAGDQWKGVAQPGSTLATALDAIVAQDR